MDAITVEACRLLFECMDELRLHDEEYGHVTRPALKNKLQAFLGRHGMGSAGDVIDKSCCTSGGE